MSEDEIEKMVANDNRIIAMAVLYKLIYEADFGVLKGVDEILNALEKVRFVRIEEEHGIKAGSHRVGRCLDMSFQCYNCLKKFNTRKEAASVPCVNEEMKCSSCDGELTEYEISRYGQWCAKCAGES